MSTNPAQAFGVMQVGHVSLDTLMLFYMSMKVAHSICRASVLCADLHVSCGAPAMLPFPLTTALTRICTSPQHRAHAQPGKGVAYDRLA